jgi:hypothetical protein
LGVRWGLGTLGRTAAGQCRADLNYSWKRDDPVEVLGVTKFFESLVGVFYDCVGVYGIRRALEEAT